MGPIVAVVLAAGQGRRMGQTKQLLPWGQESVVRVTLKRALACDADTVMLVTGHDHGAVSREADGLAVTIVHNPDHDAGEMLSSLQVAVRALPAGTSAILVMLADQPFIPTALLNSIIATYQAGNGRLIAPRFGERRGNPVLIGADLFAQLLTLPHGSAPRQLFKDNPGAVHLLPVDDASVIEDLDKPEDYQRLKAKYLMNIKIIATGGTIDKIYFDAKSAFQVGDPQVIEVLQESNVSYTYEVISLLRKDSLEITDEDRQLIRQTVANDTGRYYVITHGTDTMAHTARALVDLEDKVICLTGAMQPARFKLTDAVYNIASALTAVQLLPPGVYIAMNGRIFDPLKTDKNWDAGRFEGQAVGAQDWDR